MFRTAIAARLVQRIVRLNSQRGVRDPGELFSIRIGDANRHASEVYSYFAPGTGRDALHEA